MHPAFGPSAEVTRAQGRGHHQAAKGIGPMRWMLMGPWPIAGGARLLPAGTILSDADPSWPRPPPLDAVPLDLESALFMLKSYDPDLWHRIVFARDLDRDALLAKERERRRWPNGPPAQTSQPINERKDPTDAEVPPKAIETNQAQAKTDKAKATTRPRR